MKAKNIAVLALCLFSVPVFALRKNGKQNL